MLNVRGEKLRICYFYNYDPKDKVCWLNHLEPGSSLLRGDPGNWETWIPVEPKYKNRNYQNKVKSFAYRFHHKIIVM